ncbi:MAG TPA: DUF423 domain-containing protein [Xanthomonadaceae bacterium]|nr:DUF423 domain-containing protein [Xanthomonadaceae bacterium]
MNAMASRTSAPLAAAGALCAATAVALGAYAAHGGLGDDRALVQTAAAVAFGHGIALAALGRGPAGRLRALALAALLLGTLLFAGSVALHALAGLPVAAAPFGGGLLIVGWLLLAVDFARR